MKCLLIRSSSFSCGWLGFDLIGAELLAILQNLPPDHLALEVRVGEWLPVKSMELWIHQREQTADGLKGVRFLSLST